MLQTGGRGVAWAASREPGVVTWWAGRRPFLGREPVWGAGVPAAGGSGGEGAGAVCPVNGAGSECTVTSGHEYSVERARCGVETLPCHRRETHICTRG